jgi:hypothetical protein
LAKEYFRERYRAAGYYEGAILSSLSDEGAEALTADRAATRAQVPLPDSDSNAAGDQNFFVTSPIWGIPSAAGYWPWRT